MKLTMTQSAVNEARISDDSSTCDPIEVSKRILEMWAYPTSFRATKNFPTNARVRRTHRRELRKMQTDLGQHNPAWDIF